MMQLPSDSLLSIFKIGVGPSSSHTSGPMIIAKKFIHQLKQDSLLDSVVSLKVELYGSLSATGGGHMTDIAVLLGLFGYDPVSIDYGEILTIINEVKDHNLLKLANEQQINFNIQTDIVFSPNALTLHPNGMMLYAFNSQHKLLLQQTYFSIGGGYISTQEELLDQQHTNKHQHDQLEPVAEYNQASLSNNLEDIKEDLLDFQSIHELLALCKKYNKEIYEIALLREKRYFSISEITHYYEELWQVMKDSIWLGINNQEEYLPGGLKVKRRANYLYQRLMSANNKLLNDDFYTIEWLSMFAIAVSEQNAAGQRIVTAPTNGACGVIPAILAYYDKFYHKLDSHSLLKFFLTSAAVCHVYRSKSSISGAEAGCQAEIGVASSIGAVGFASLLSVVPEVAFEAGEIAMEHHLGMTCDPIAGLVQVPCIERNAFGATKAILAAKMALARENNCEGVIVNLDQVIEVMYNTGKDMDVKYRETSCGGLAKVIQLAKHHD